MRCKDPVWCTCDDCHFWRTYRLLRSKRYAPRVHVRAWRTLKRWARENHPVALLRNIEMGGYDYERGTASPEARVASMALRRWEQAVHVGHALFGKWDMDQARSPLCERTLYRLKAAVCIVLGWEPRDMSDRCECFGFTFWGVEEYGTPDGPGGSCVELHVGYGWGNWFAYVEHESWP